MCPHVGDDAAASIPGLHRVPGPAHTTSAPSPVLHCTRTGLAVAVTDNPGTPAVADRGTHDPEPSHNHVGTFTNCGAGGAGLNLITGPGNRNVATALRATTAGSTEAAASPAGTQSGRVPEDHPSPEHRSEYQPPGPVTPAGGGSSLTRTHSHGPSSPLALESTELPGPGPLPLSSAVSRFGLSTLMRQFG